MQIIMVDKAKENLTIEQETQWWKESIKPTFEKQVSKLKDEERQEEQKTAEELRAIEEAWENKDQTDSKKENKDKKNVWWFAYTAEERKEDHPWEANQNRIDAGKTIVQDLNDPREKNNIFARISKRILWKNNL